jgi:hypothetical protein
MRGDRVQIKQGRMTPALDGWVSRGPWFTRAFSDYFSGIGMEK